MQDRHSTILPICGPCMQNHIDLLRTQHHVKPEGVAGVDSQMKEAGILYRNFELNP